MRLREGVPQQAGLVEAQVRVRSSAEIRGRKSSCRFESCARIRRAAGKEVTDGHPGQSFSTS